MNRETNMKKLTALLLGTVISIAFTASDAFADEKMKYWNSNDGRTGGYLGVSYTEGSISDIKANYLRGPAVADSTWKLDDGEGGQVQFGFDFGKIRLDWRVGALYSHVASIDNAVKDQDASDEAVLGYTTLNVDLDLYRFHVGDLLKAGWPGTPFNIDIAATPYVGAGWGYGAGWMTGKKLSTTNQKQTEPAGHGYAHTYEAGILVNLSDWAGITLAYNHLKLYLDGHGARTSKTKVESDLFSAGVRFTY